MELDVSQLSPARMRSAAYRESVKQATELKLVGMTPDKLAAFPYPPDLTTLTLLRGRLPSLEAMPYVPSLQFLSVLQCHLSTLTGAPAHLEELFVESNDLSSLEGMPDMPDLCILSVVDNSLTSLAGMSPVLPSLQELHAANNRISTLHGMPYMPSLEILDLDNNKLRTPNGLPFLPRLGVVYLEHNQLVSVAGILTTLPALDELYIRGNSIPRYRVACISRRIRLEWDAGAPLEESIFVKNEEQQGCVICLADDLPTVRWDTCTCTASMCEECSGELFRIGHRRCTVCSRAVDRHLDLD